MKAELDLYRRNADPVAQFVNECIEKSSSDFFISEWPVKVRILYVRRAWLSQGGWYQKKTHAVHGWSYTKKNGQQQGQRVYGFND